MNGSVIGPSQQASSGCAFKINPQRSADLANAGIRSAADLLTSDEAARVRECAAESCSWLFVDRSRTRRRRWCDMKTCGNRNKAKLYYQRHRKRSKN